jgi:chromosome segregation ATPase
MKTVKQLIQDLENEITQNVHKHNDAYNQNPKLQEEIDKLKIDMLQQQNSDLNDYLTAMWHSREENCKNFGDVENQIADNRDKIVKIKSKAK